MSFNFTVHTDKIPGGWHAAYMPVYERLFEKFKDRACRVMEIGTDGGGCLLAYADYFDRGTIYGIDINPAPESIKGHPRIKHYQKDAYAPIEMVMVGTMSGMFDIVIDDGPHTIQSQLFFVEHYTKMLTPDGIAIVEDVQDPSIIARLTAAMPFGFFGFSIDLRAVKPERYDNLLFCVVRN